MLHKTVIIRRVHPFNRDSLALQYYFEMLKCNAFLYSLVVLIIPF